MKRNYSEILHGQRRLNKEIINRYGTMTENERLMNIRDLKHFEESSTFLSAMIPGINNINSIGSRPTCRGGRAIINGSFISPESMSTKAINSTYIATPILKRTKYYNPITNPIPMISQNPYVVREVKNLIQNQRKEYTPIPSTRNKNLI